MTRFTIDARGSWSGGGRAFLSNARHAASRYPDMIAVGDPKDHHGFSVLPRNVPTSMKSRAPSIIIPQNAWAWHGPALDPRSVLRRSALRAGSEVQMLRARGVIRIGPMIPERGNCHPQLLPNVLDASFEEALIDSRHLEPKDTSEYLLGVGSLNSYRNYETVLDAHAQYLKQGGTRHLHIIGGGDSRYLQRLGQPSGVTFHGALSRAETLAWMRHSSLTVLPSLVEASPMTALEALAVGAPLAVSDIPGHMSMVQNKARVETFPSFDGTALANLMRRPNEGPATDGSTLSSRTQQRNWWSDRLVQQLRELTSP